MHTNEHKGEDPAPVSAPPAAPIGRRTPPGEGNVGSRAQITTSCSQAGCHRESTRAPKLDNEPNSSSRSMPVLPKTGENRPSGAPSSSSHAHMASSPPAPLAPLPLAMPSETLRPSLLLPLLRCALCRLLLTAPTTLNCGHTVCSKHMNESPDEEPGSSESSFGQCPVDGCKPRQPARVHVVGHLNQVLRAGVTFIPAASTPSEPSPTRVVKLDVAVSKLLELITTTARRNTAPCREDSPATDDESGRRSPLPDRSSRESTQSPPRPRKKARTHPPVHTPTGLPDPSDLSFEKELLSELTCEICFMLLCNPITTPCQHTFCSTCLERSLDHSTKCPLCRLDLPPNAYFYQHAHNEVIVQIIAKSFPNLLEERVAISDTDGRDSRLDTPIFVCQLSYPGMPTLLHFFEPRYRLMLRRCLASPTPRFGMVMPRQNANNTDGNDYGTMLEIKNVQMLSDGRSMVETYGTFRFRILERGTLDGYLVGRIERIDDYAPEVEAEIERIAMMNPSEDDLAIRGIERSNQELVDICRRFLDQLRNGTAPWVVQRLNNTYGPMPNDVASFSFWVALVLPIDEQEKAKLIPIRSPRMRLRLVVHWIEQLNNNWWFSSGQCAGSAARSYAPSWHQQPLIKPTSKTECTILSLSSPLMPRVLATTLLALHAAAQFALAQNPENKANSVVPYQVPAEPKYDYAEVLHKSLLFYHAQRSGKLGPNRRLAWRGDSCFDCTGPNGEDLSGGYFEAANTMKWGLPLAWTLTQLSFNVHVFSEAMQAVNEYDEALEGIKWGTDYLVNCISSPDQFVGHLGVSAIGETDIDFGYFGPAEEYEMWAPRGIKRSDGIAYINSTNPSSEILGESAAALAAASVVFATKDKAYSDKLRGHAVDLYTRAITHQGSYMKSTHPNLQTLKSWYPSTIFEDELAWAAAWLHVATGDEQWRRTADEWIAKAGSHLGEYSWDEKLPGVNMLLFLQTKNETYKASVEQYFNNYQPSGSVKQTAKGLSFYYGWGSLRYASNVGFIMMAYSKTIGYDNPNATWPRQYAAQQINYALGDAGRSWVVGFGKDSPVRPYHKSSYNSFIDYPMRGQDNGAQGEDFLFSSTVNRFILYGALEGGPAWNDTFKDDRSSYEYTDEYRAPKFKAFTDCGLDLGWSHPNASNPPQWPENDCYHTCNTNCVKTVPENESNAGNTNPNPNPESSGSTSAAMASATTQGLTIGLLVSSILGALTLL
ncbi:unnamed protein product [Rhizoctonia solani]|nr:unnamed protein product [Rhizoctonia solani]